MIKQMNGKEVLTNAIEATIRVGSYIGTLVVLDKVFIKPKKKIMELKCDVAKAERDLANSYYCDVIREISNLKK